MGNSHPAAAFNDTLVPGLWNVAKGGEWYIYGYAKLERIIRDNAGIESVYLEVDELMMYKKTDRLNWRDNALGVYYNYNSPFISLPEEQVLLKENPLGYIRNIPFNIRVTWREFSRNGRNFANAREFKEDFIADESKVNNELIDKESAKQYRPKDIRFNQVNVEYIHKIEALCASHGIDVFFIRCPVHKEFEGRRYEDLFQQFLAQNFPDRTFIDLVDLPIPDDYFHDLDHLNISGANYFTTYFRDRHLQ